MNPYCDGGPCDTVFSYNYDITNRKNALLQFYSMTDYTQKYNFVITDAAGN